MASDHPNSHLRAAREARPSPSVPGEVMGRAELAEAVNDYLWRTTGRRHPLDSHTIARYERGKVRWPNATYRAGFRAVLGAESDAELGFRPTRRGSGGEAATPKIQEPAAGDGHASMDSGPLMFVSGSAPPQGVSAVSSPGWSERDGSGRRRPALADRTGVADFDVGLAEGAAETVRAFRVADRQVGGGYLYTAVQRYSTSQLGPQLGSATTDDEVFCATAGIAEMSGWMAHDAGWDQRAAQHFRRAHQLAQVGGDTALAAQVMASRSHLALYAGDVEDGQQCAEAGWRLLGGQEDRAVRARLLAMRARAAARMGEGHRFREFLGQAEGLLGTTEVASSPWTSPFDVGSLASEASRGLCDLRDFSAGIAHAQRALELRSAERPRARALARLVLATARMGRGEIDDACAQVQAVSTTIGGVSSRVVAQQFDTAVEHLRRFGSSRVVGQALPELEATVRHTRQQLHWLGAEEEQGGFGGRGL